MNGALELESVDVPVSPAAQGPAPSRLPADEVPLPRRTIPMNQMPSASTISTITKPPSGSMSAH
ncbi:MULTISPECIES: hypothetical protein [unclassified Nocardia]|uniref:hypothetical protein n=1 Tax=unclassified Nocardia TaxID=2637762 RepID=UPI001CE42A2A|nr:MULTISPECIES: hypothetical protein [unclassified Nocardia]